MKMISKSFVIITALTVSCVVCGVVLSSWRKKQRRKRLTSREVIVITSPDQWEEIYEIRVRQDLQNFGVLGFDCEWNGKSQPVALIQLATKSGLCVLLRLCKMKDRPKSLLEVLGDKSVLKVGVGCLDDALKLFQCNGIVVRGCVDLRHLVLRLPQKYWPGKLGLKTLAKEFLDITYSNKNKSCVYSDWEAEVLNQNQIDYASLDAMVGIRLLEELQSLSFTSLRGLIDCGFKYKPTNNKVENNSTKISKKFGHMTLQNPLYENCYLQAPDGQVLCTCDKKKINWYLEKGLGNLVSEEPLTLKLKFEPSGRPKDDSLYYVTEKENKCVVCGSLDFLTRKNVIPHEYKEYFPEIMKNYQSHDIILLCRQCHKTSNMSDANLRKQLAEICDAKIDTGNNVKFTIRPELKSVHSAGRALLKSADKIPLERKTQLQNILKKFYKTDDLTEDILNNAANLEIAETITTYVPHGQKVVEYFGKQPGGLIAFQRTWRTHFLDSMEPKHLPSLWSVDHNHSMLMEKAMQANLSPQEMAVIGLENNGNNS